MTFDTDFSRLNEEFLSEKLKREQPTLQALIRRSAELFMKTHLINPHMRLRFVEDPCSMYIDLAVHNGKTGICRLGLEGTTLDLSLLRYVSGDIIASYPRINCIKMSIEAQQSLKRSLGYVSLFFTDDKPFLLQMRSQDDLRKKLCLPDVDDEVLRYADFIQRSSSSYVDDDPSGTLIKENLTIAKGQSHYTASYALESCADCCFLESIDKAENIFEEMIKFTPDVFDKVETHAR